MNVTVILYVVSYGHVGLLSFSLWMSENKIVGRTLALWGRSLEKT